jgi:uncharacterized delta-60 repeat protein
MGLRITLLMAATMGAAAMGHGQQPFELDQSFSTTIESVGASGIAVLADGKVLVSGQIKFPGDVSFRSLVRLNENGSRDVTFPVGLPGGGKLVEWNGRYYVGSGQLMRRVWPDGTVDAEFQSANLDPLFQSGQGGDFHVYPNGSLLITGTHTLYDTARGFVGLYNLIWLTNTGRLDTTKVHRRANGDLMTIQELPDGKFIVGGGMTLYDGHVVGDIIRIFPNGDLDTTFNTTARWFWPHDFLPLADGKVICTGDVVFSGSDDTLHVFRLLPDGSLDPDFNNTLAMWRTYDLDGKAGAMSIQPLGQDRYVVTGFFNRVEGEVRGGIALIDTAGFLIDELFGTGGCGTYWDGFETTGGIKGMQTASDGSIYIYGSYHGYNDDTTNDPAQRMVSRLYGLDVGVREEPLKASGLQVYPNPADGLLHVQWRTTGGHYTLFLLDILGREVLRQDVSAVDQRAELDLKGIASGTYYLHLRDDKRWLAGNKVVVE